jgi:hypothetical protein
MKSHSTRSAPSGAQLGDLDGSCSDSTQTAGCGFGRLDTWSQQGDRRSPHVQNPAFAGTREHRVYLAREFSIRCVPGRMGSVGWNSSMDHRLPCLITSRSAYVERRRDSPGWALLQDRARPEAQQGHGTCPRRECIWPEAALDLKEEPNSAVCCCPAIPAWSATSFSSAAMRRLRFAIGRARTARSDAVRPFGTGAACCRSCV